VVVGTGDSTRTGGTVAVIVGVAVVAVVGGCGGGGGGRGGGGVVGGRMIGEDSGKPERVGATVSCAMESSNRPFFAVRGLILSNKEGVNLFGARPFLFPRPSCTGG